MAHNVPAVNDVFLRPMRKNAKHFFGRKKMWRSKIPQRGEAPTGILRSPSRRRRRSVYQPVMRCAHCFVPILHIYFPIYMDLIDYYYPIFQNKYNYFQNILFPFQYLRLYLYIAIQFF